MAFGWMACQHLEILFRTKTAGWTWNAYSRVQTSVTCGSLQLNRSSWSQIVFNCDQNITKNTPYVQSERRRYMLTDWGSAVGAYSQIPELVYSGRNISSGRSLEVHVLLDSVDGCYFAVTWECSNLSSVAVSWHSFIIHLKKLCIYLKHVTNVCVQLKAGEQYEMLF